MLGFLSLIAAEGGAEAVKNPVLPTVPEMVWGAIAFFTLWALMRTVLLPPIQREREKRTEQVRADQEAAEKALADAEGVRRDYDATLREARSEASRIVEDARVLAEERRSEVVGAAEAELAAARAAALDDVATQRGAALGSLGDAVGTIAAAAASKVVDRPIDVGAATSAAARVLDAESGSRGAS